MKPASSMGLARLVRDSPIMPGSFDAQHHSVRCKVCVHFNEYIRENFMFLFEKLFGASCAETITITFSCFPELLSTLDNIREKLSLREMRENT